MRLIFSVLILMMLVGCASQAMKADGHERHCASLLVAADVVQCYNNETSILIARRITFDTRSFSDGDWPHDFQMLVQLQVEDTGFFEVESVLRSSGSHLLDKRVLESLVSVKKIFVPPGALFRTAKYANLKLLIKPARTPLLGDEELIDSDALVVYVSKVLR